MSRNRSNYLGEVRPTYGPGSFTPQVSLPDTIHLAPIRLPRALAYESNGYKTPVYPKETDYQRRLDGFTSRRLSSLSLAMLDNGRRRRSRSVGDRLFYPYVDESQPLRAYERNLRSGSPVFIRPSFPDVVRTLSLEDSERDVTPASTALEVTKRALVRNMSVGHQRVLVILTKFPALALLFVSLWTILSRGEGMSRLNEETGADVSAIVTSGILLFANVFLISNHHYSYKKIKTMGILYYIVMSLALIASTISLVFAAISVSKLKTISPVYSCKWAATSKCLSPSDRINYMSIILGADCMIICLSILSCIYGAIGQSRLDRRLREEYRRLNSLKAHENPAMQY